MCCSSEFVSALLPIESLQVPGCIIGTVRLGLCWWSLRAARSVQHQDQKEEREKLGVLFYLEKKCSLPTPLALSLSLSLPTLCLLDTLKWVASSLYCVTRCNVCRSDSVGLNQESVDFRLHVTAWSGESFGFFHRVETWATA